MTTLGHVDVKSSTLVLFDFGLIGDFEDAQGAPVRCTITFATEESLEAMREVNGM